MEIRKLEIDLDNDILKINDESRTEKPILVTLPGPDGWPLKKLFNSELASGNPEEHDQLTVIDSIDNKPLSNRP